MKLHIAGALALVLSSSATAQTQQSQKWEYGVLVSNFDSDKEHVTTTLFRNFMTWTTGDVYAVGFEDVGDILDQLKFPHSKAGVFASVLNGLGNDGWELISVTNQRPSLSGYFLQQDTYYFKRQIKK